MDRSPVALITASGSGIGAAIAGRFVSAGYQVCVCDIAGETARATAVNLGSGCLAVETDVSEPKQVADLFGRCIEWGHRLDVLVNNAGIGGPRAALEETDFDEWTRTMAVNLTGAFNCIKAAVPTMKSQGEGCIINISTASVRTGLPLRTAYVASKAGLMGLTLNAARELGPSNIRCNAILPGLIRNARGKKLVRTYAAEKGLTAKEASIQMSAFVSLRTWIEEDEVGDVAVFLASREARHITGQYLGVDGNLEWET
jgi:NAD(P)-dependent dehydrogenase (short-subunit alcohol dehydrogenase family)